SVDGAGRRAGQLLVADRPHQLGEVRAARAAPPQVGGTECVDDGSEAGLLRGQRRAPLDHRAPGHGSQPIGLPDAAPPSYFQGTGRRAASPGRPTPPVTSPACPAVSLVAARSSPRSGSRWPPVVAAAGGEPRWAPQRV